jgi:hypothetical protein
VYGGWIDRLRAHRLGKKNIGTITPWSNNATILSYPLTLVNNDFDLELGFDALDHLAAGALAGVVCDLPTGVGFCFYVGRDCLDDVGPFNTSAFGRGYGEENDFCLRAAARGWRNIAACDVLVRHTGEASFQAEGIEARRLASIALLKLHPKYNELIGAFIRADPMRPHRQTLDLARLKRWGDGQLLLVFDHDRSGLEPPFENAVPLVAPDGNRVVRAWPPGDGAETLAMHPVGDLVLPSLPRLPIRDVAAAKRTMSTIGVTHARIRSLRGYSSAESSFAHELCEQLGG